MDLQFASKLQKALTEIGTKNGLAPPTSQDPADLILHEYYVAEMGRSLFDKRRKRALDLVKALAPAGKVNKLLDDAMKKGIVGTTSITDSANYSSSVTLKTPTEGHDITVIRNNLVRAGVALDVINTAFDTAKTKNKAAETWTVSVKTS